MKRFLITVNGRTYEVEVEEVSDFAAAPTRQAAVQAAPAAPVAPAPSAPAPAEAPAAKAAEAPAPANIPANGTKIVAPMPGKILAVKASPGQAVKRGDVLLILEAMKMENEIQAPADGTVTAIAVSEGSSVNAGALLAVIS